MDLSEYSRINKITEDPIFLDPKKILDELRVTFQDEIEIKNAEITVENLNPFLGYPSFFSILLQNLIANALKYSEPNRSPKIHFSMAERENDYVFQLTDNGVGIDAEYFDKIFILFQRLQQKNAGRGTGMGLAIAKKITDMLGGEIWVSSEVGKGSVFTFTLPNYEKVN